MDEICDDLRASADKVVTRWDELARGAPWDRLPEDWRRDHLPEVVRDLAGLALCHPADAAAVERHLTSVAEHGTERRQQAVEEVHLFREYQVLRQAIAEYLRGRWGRKEAVLNAMVRIDTAITAATRACLLGYYRSELEREDRWPAALEQAVRDFPFVE